MKPDFRGLWALAGKDFAAFRATMCGALEATGDAFSLLREGPRRATVRSWTTRRWHGRIAPMRARPRGMGLAGVFEDAGAVVGAWPLDLDAVRCPAHVWHGALDANAPATMGRWLAGCLRAARDAEWPGAAHFEWFHRLYQVLQPHAGL